MSVDVALSMSVTVALLMSVYVALSMSVTVALSMAQGTQTCVAVSSWWPAKQFVFVISASRHGCSVLALSVAKMVQFVCALFQQLLPFFSSSIFFFSFVFFFVGDLLCYSFKVAKTMHFKQTMIQESQNMVKWQVSCFYLCSVFLLVWPCLELVRCWDEEGGLLSLTRELFYCLQGELLPWTFALQAVSM